MPQENIAIKKTQKPILPEAVWGKKATEAVRADNVADFAALHPAVKADSLIRLHEADETPEPALFVATRGGCLKIVRWLVKNALDEGICIASIKAKTGQTPLMIAADTGAQSIVDALLPHSDVRAADESGNTALMFAAAKMRPKTIQAMLAASDAKAMNKNQQSAIMRAASGGMAGNVRILAPHSDLGARDRNGHTVFEATMKAAISGEGFITKSDDWEIIDLLAPSQPRAQIDVLFAFAGAKKMPQWAALMEAEALAEVMQIQKKTDGEQKAEPNALSRRL